MTSYGGIGAWVILGAAVLTAACTTTVPGHPSGNADGGTSGNLLGGSETSTGENAGTSNGTDTGTAPPSGSRESSAAALEKAVLSSAGASCNAKEGASACTLCALRACCTQTSACLDSNFCTTLSGCMAKCEDNDCVRDCADQYGPGAPTYQDLQSCALSYCQESCP